MNIASGLWHFARNHPGILLVLFGVVGEVIFGWREMIGKHAKYEKGSAVMLILGLAIELRETVNADREIANLTSDNISLQTNVLTMRSNVLVMEVAVRDLIHLYDQSTNALAEAKERLKAIRPLKERITECLNQLDSQIIVHLRRGTYQFDFRSLESFQINRLHSLQLEPGGQNYIIELQEKSDLIFNSSGGISHPLKMILSPELVR